MFLDKLKVPHQPGVYIFKDKTGKVLYVGKAIDLYHRVSSYFHSNQANSKTAVLAENITKVDTIIVESELEALILEANLIKKHLPPFNIRLVDDKDYLYIAITKGDFSQVITARKKDLTEAKKYWGPFPSARTVRETLKSLRKVFPWCSNLHSRSVNSNPLLEWKRPCFYYHLGQCPGACVNLISKQGYQKIMASFTKFMDGRKDKLVSDLTRQMSQVSNKQQFEIAAGIKKTLSGISYITQTNRTKLYLENPNFLEDERQLALKVLQKDLGLKKLPERIEGYDISNIQGREATGSMVVLTSGEIDKSQYRKFRIRVSGRPNDVGMMREMLRRRLSHPEWPIPDLIIVDGGKGQVNGANLETENWKLEIPMFGLAKKMEWLYSPGGEIVKLPKKSLSLKLLQKLRDEAHRFAVSYHRKLHQRAILNMM